MKDLRKVDEFKIYSGVRISLLHQGMGHVCVAYMCIFTNTTSCTQISTQLILIMYGFHICEFTCWLKFTLKSILTALWPSFISMHICKQVKNLSCLTHIFLTGPIMQCSIFLFHLSYCKQVSFPLSNIFLN